MGQHTTKYETMNGKTRKVKKAGKTAKGASERSGADNTNPSGTPAKQGAQS